MIKRAGPHPEIPGKSEQAFPTQDITDLDIIEDIDCLPEDYQPLAVETVHPDSAITGLAPILVWQGKSPIQSDPPKMRRVYKTLPGAWVTDTRIDTDGAVVTIKTRKALNRLIVSSESLSAGFWTKTTNGPGGDAVVGDEVVETRFVPGNAIAPQSVSKDGDVTSETRQMVAAAGFVATSAVSGGTWTRIFDEKVEGSSLVVWKVTQVRATQATVPSYSVEIPERAIPQKLRSALPTKTTETTEKGTASMPTLDTGDFFRSQTQLDQYTYRLKIVNLSLDSLPSPVTDKSTTDKYGGGPTTITWTLTNVAPAVDTGLLVLSSQVDSLGNGLYLKTTTAADGAWPALTDADVDDNYGFVNSSTVQVVAPESITPGFDSGSNSITEARKIDQYRSEKIVRTAPTTALDSIVLSFPDTVNIDLPPVLSSVVGHISYNEGSGGYTMTSNSGFTVSGSWNSSPHATAQASTSILPDVEVNITTVWGNDIPAISYYFFMPSGTTESAIRTRLGSIAGRTVNPWPRFRPTAHTLVLVGKRLSVQADANGSTYYQANTLSNPVTTSFSWTNGTGTSQDAGISIKTVRIPPTIHPTVNISGSTTLSKHLSVTADAGVFNIGPGGPSMHPIGSCSGDVDASITPTTLAATTGDMTIPTTGLYLRKVHCEPYRFGKTRRLLVEALVVDFANVG